jgi:hypothetical protein
MKPQQSKPIFLSVSAQEENLGDLILRKAIVDWVRSNGDTTHVYVGSMPAPYIAALNLDGFHIYDDIKAWTLALARYAVRGPSGFVFSPGQQGLVFRRAEFVHAIANVGLALLVRIRGGVVVKIGRSLEGSNIAMLTLERILRGLSTHYWLRDPRSGRTLGGRFETIPDVAVVAERAVVRTGFTADARKYAVLSFRHDRDLPLDVISEYVETASEIGLTPILVTQVWKDDQKHAELAATLGIQHLAWADRDHAQQHRRVERIYDDAATILSNRLHSLILGWNSGAMPIGHSSPSDRKIRDHMIELGLRDFVVSSGMEVSPLVRRAVQASTRDQLDRIHREATARVLAVKKLLQDTLLSSTPVS